MYDCSSKLGPGLPYRLADAATLGFLDFRLAPMLSLRIAGLLRLELLFMYVVIYL